MAKSNYYPGPGPTSETRTYKRGPNGVEGTIERRFANGRSQRIEYVAEYDREYPVSHAGRVYGVARRVIAPSGASMTITLNRESSTGPNVLNRAVYERVIP